LGRLRIPHQIYIISANARTARGIATAIAILVVDVPFDAKAADTAAIIENSVTKTDVEDVLVVPAFAAEVLPDVFTKIAGLDVEVPRKVFPVVPKFSARVLLEILVDEAAKSELSNTILTPYALKPPGDENVIILVEVIPAFDESVTGNSHRRSDPSAKQSRPGVRECRRVSAGKRHLAADGAACYGRDCRDALGIVTGFNIA
jgi:hypothetical protein